MPLAIIVHADRSAAMDLHRIIDTGRCEIITVPDHAAALETMRRTEGHVDFVIDGWEVPSPSADFHRAMRDLAAGKETVHLRLASPEDYAWVAAIFHTPGILDAIFERPFRANSFARAVKQLVAVDPLSKPRALVVDDDDVARSILTQYLTSFGFSKIEQAEDGAQALAILEKRYTEFSLVVSDWQMPNLTGIELLRSVRKKPWLSRLPFVMITAQSPAEPIKTLQAAEMGVSGYLLKPFNSKTFQSQMDGILHEVKKAREAESVLIAGRVLLGLADFMHAEEKLNEGVRLFPTDATLWEAVGDAQLLKARDARNLAPAVESYERAVKLHPANVSAVLKYFELTSALGRMNDAVRALKGHLHRSELEDTLRTRLGKLYLASGDIDSARAEFSRAVAHNPANGEAAHLLEDCVPAAKKRKAG